MAENDFRDSARRDKPEMGPLLIRGALYSIDQLQELLGISKRTLARWEQAGLKIRQPGTKRAFVISDDVFELMLHWTSDEGDSE